MQYTTIDDTIVNFAEYRSTKAFKEFCKQNVDSSLLRMDNYPAFTLKDRSYYQNSDSMMFDIRTNLRKLINDGVLSNRVGGKCLEIMDILEGNNYEYSNSALLAVADMVKFADSEGNEADIV
jgi:hypothetical protein